MKRKVALIIIAAALISLLAGCDLYLNFISQFGISADAEARLKVEGQVWGLASSGGYLYAVAYEDDGPVVYKIVEETFTLETSYPLSGGSIEDQFSYYDDNEWTMGGRFQGYTDSLGIFYIMDTRYGGRIWLNDTDTTARYLPASSYSSSFTFFFSAGGTDYALTYNDFQDLTVYDIQGAVVVATLDISGSYHLEGALFLPDSLEVQLLYVPYQSGSEASGTITCQSVTLDAAAVGSWDSAYPYGGTAVSLSLGDKEYNWTGYGGNDTGSTNVYPSINSFFGNDELFQFSSSDVESAQVWLFEEDGTFTDIIYINEKYRPILSSSGRTMFGVYENIILKYGID